MAAPLVPSNPGWPTGYTPSAVEWANEWSRKVDFPAPINQGGTGGQTVATANANLQQRTILDGGAATSIATLTAYGLRTSTAPFELYLPALSTCTPGDWVDLVDVDFFAATNTIQIFASGSDRIKSYGIAGAVATMDVSGQQARLVAAIDGDTMFWDITEAGLPPAIVSATGAEVVVVYANGVPKTLTTQQIGNTGNIDVAYGLQLATWFNQTPSASELMALYTSPISYVYPANFSGSYSASPLTNPSATFVLDVNRRLAGSPSWTNVGTITVSTTGVVTFATASGLPISMGVGDQLQVLAPSTPDATITGFAATLKGTLS